MKSKMFAKVCSRAGEAVGKYEMIREGDRVLVGVSGGKDSLLLLLVLKHLQAKAPVKFTFAAATFDPGFEGFDASSTADFCRDLGVEHHTVGMNIPSLLDEKKATGRPCVLCSRVRRGSLYSLAAEKGFPKLALGQHLDDAIVSFLISFSRGGGLTTMGPNVPSENGKFQIIRPLIFCTEKMTRAAAEELNLPVHGECVFKEQLQENGDRAFFRERLDQLERTIPGVRENMLHSLSDLRPAYLLDSEFIPGLNKLKNGKAERIRQSDRSRSEQQRESYSEE